MMRRRSGAGSAKHPGSRARGQPTPNGSGAVSAAAAIQRMVAARSAAIRAADILALQRTAGNQATTRLLAAREPTPEVSKGRIREAAAEGVKTPSASLPHTQRIQDAFGHHDVSRIRAHVGPQATRSAAMRAAAYAVGDHVAFAGTPSLHTAAHEAAHVIQQRRGVHLAGGVGEVGDTHERHADEVADHVAAGRSAEHLLDRFVVESGGDPAGRSAAPPTSGAPIQAKFIYDNGASMSEQGAQAVASVWQDASGFGAFADAYRDSTVLRRPGRSSSRISIPAKELPSGPSSRLRAPSPGSSSRPPTA